MTTVQGRRRSPPKRRARPRRAGTVSRGRAVAIAAAAILAAAGGTYFATLYAETSQLLARRHAALTSSIFAAPHALRAGDDVAGSRLVERLASLSYSEVERASLPGEWSRSGSEIAIFVREFRYGAERHPARLVRLRIEGGGRIAAVEDPSEGSVSRTMLEPRAIGRLIPGTAAERVEIRLEHQKPYLVGGMLAVEDQFFYWHPGVNPVRIVAAAIRDLRERRLAAGASTLTQQLARTFLERRERTFARKLSELALALVLEVQLTKDAILERYINDVSLGAYEGAPIHGMPQAARYFFHKDLAHVTPAEAAILIGMVKAPTAYDPRRHPEACAKRRDVVLAVMKKQGLIDEQEYAEAVRSPVEVRRPAGLRRAPYFADYVISALETIPGLDGDRAGVQVFTTLDAEIQAAAVSATGENLEKLEQNSRSLRGGKDGTRLQTAAVVLDAGTGAIRAMVGGRDYSESQFNRAASALRQPGSAFKPVVYLAAMDPARTRVRPPLTLASVLPNVPMRFGAWSPANYEPSRERQVTTIRAIADSLNIPAAYVGNRLGPELVVRTAHDLGIRTKLEAMPPIAIGAEETTLLDLTAMYQVLANAGTRSPPYAIESVVGPGGREIYRHQASSERVVDPAVAYLVTSALEAVVTSGTGASAKRLGLDFPAAGKTGTTQDYRDALFVGYTPALVCGVWVGFDAPRSLGLTGAQAALPPWVEILKASAPARPGGFREPAGIVHASIDPQTGGLATSDCDRRVSVPFLEGTAPVAACPVHERSVVADAAGNWGGWKSSVPEAKAGPGRPTVFRKVGDFFGKLFRR